MARILDFVAYLGLLLSEGVFRLLPLDWIFSFGEVGGEIAYRILRHRRRLALRNLRLAFGHQMSDDELDAINRRHFQLLGANLLAGLKLATLPNEKIWERVTIENLPTERPPRWIALISHTGNWELYRHLVDQSPEYRFAGVYQPLRNKFADRHIRATRTRLGVTLFDRRTQLLGCVRFLREGGVLGVLADQGAGYAGLWTPLFGRLTSSSTLPAILSIRSDSPILPMAIATCGRARWKISALRPILPQPDAVEEMTADINRVLEEKVLQSPADWLWAHNRWKALRPHVLFTRERRRVFIPPAIEPSSLDPFRIVIVGPASAARATASFDAVRAIKGGRPDAHVTVLTPASLEPIWQNSGVADAVVGYRDDDSVFSLAKKIRAEKAFDVSIAFSDGGKTATALRLAGIPRRVGRGMFSNQHPPSPNESDPRRTYLQIAWSVGADVSAVTV